LLRRIIEQPKLPSACSTKRLTPGIETFVAIVLWIVGWLSTSLCRCSESPLELNSLASGALELIARRRTPRSKPIVRFPTPGEMDCATPTTAETRLWLQCPYLNSASGYSRDTLVPSAPPRRNNFAHVARCAFLEARKHIRIVFNDIHMPGSMDGLQEAHAIRHRWRHRLHSDWRHSLQTCRHYKRSVVENRNVAVYEATAISLGASGNMHVVMPYMWTGSSKTGQVYREQHSIERCPCGNKCRQRHPDALTTPD